MNQLERTPTHDLCRKLCELTGTEDEVHQQVLSHIANALSVTVADLGDTVNAVAEVDEKGQLNSLSAEGEGEYFVKKSAVSFPIKNGRITGAKDLRKKKYSYLTFLNKIPGIVVFVIGTTKTQLAVVEFPITTPPGEFPEVQLSKGCWTPTKCGCPEGSEDI